MILLGCVACRNELIILNIEQNVEFCGYELEIGEYYQMASIFAMTSLSEKLLNGISRK